MGVLLEHVKDGDFERREESGWTVQSVGVKGFVSKRLKGHTYSRIISPDLVKRHIKTLLGDIRPILALAIQFKGCLAHLLFHTKSSIRRTRRRRGSRKGDWRRGPYHGHIVSSVKLIVDS